MQEHINTKIKFLALISYLGPLFIVARLSKDKQNVFLDFHARHATTVFVSQIIAYLLIFLIQLSLESLPALREILCILLTVFVSVSYLLFTIMGINNVMQNKQSGLPFISEIQTFFKNLF